MNAIALRLCLGLICAVGVGATHHAAAQSWSGFGPPSNSNSGFFVLTPDPDPVTLQIDMDFRSHAVASDKLGRLYVLERLPYNGSNDVDCAVVTYLRDARMPDMETSGYQDATRRVFFDLGGNHVDSCMAMTVDSNNRPVVAGESETASGSSGVVARFGATAGLDANFNGDGKLALSSLAAFNTDSTHLYDVQTLGDNRVLACGSIERGGERNMLVLRFTAAGALDTTFNGSGWREIDFNGGGNDIDVCRRLLPMPNGQLIVAGTANGAGSSRQTLAVLRLNANGSIDNGFAGGGARLSVGSALDIPSLVDIGYDSARSRLLLGGNLAHPNPDLSVSRRGVVVALDNSGGLDGSFSGGGEYQFHFSDFGALRVGGNTTLTRLLVRDDGGIYLAGTQGNSATDAPNVGNSDIAVARVHANTTPDTSFYGTGVVFEPFAYVGYPNVPNSFKQRTNETLTDAMFYRGGVVLLADRDRYPTGTYDGDGDNVTENHPNAGPIVPLLGALGGDHLFDDDFEFDGLDEPTNAFPSIPVPAGFGNYCSVRDPQSGGFGLLPQGAGSDPCQDFLNSNPNLIIDRAGLWSLSGTNYVLGSCGYGAIWIRGGSGATPINQVFNDTAGQTNCTFTIAPASLPVFARPYSGAHPSYSQPFDHDPFRIPLDVTQFGQTPRPGQPLALTIDLWGLQQSDAANVYLNGIDEPATDIVIPNGRQNLAVAAGRVAFAAPRYVLQCCTPFGGDPYQREVWIRHRVGSGRYAEEFVTFYAHSKSTLVKRGDVVSAGAVLGDTGQSGGASGYHLHFATFRMRNLAWRKTYDMDWSLTNFTLNKEIAAMDAWGWRAPLNLDPWGWRFHGHDTPRSNPWGSGTMYDAGTWDINLWQPGEDAPMPQLP